MPAVRVDASCGDSQVNFPKESVVAKMMCFFPRMRDVPCEGDEDIQVSIHFSNGDPTGPPFVCQLAGERLPSFCKFGGTSLCCSQYWNNADFIAPRSGATTLMYDRHQRDNERKP